MRGIAFFIGVIAWLMTGCVQTRVTEPKRSAVEQLLISTAADRALERLNFGAFAGRKTYVDPAYFESEDKLYVLSALRNALSEAGALLMADIKEAELVVEPRNGALSTDSSTSVVGVPSTPLPVPMAGTFLTPELALFKSQKQLSTSKLALFVYEQNSRKHVSSAAATGKAKHNYYTLLGYFKYTSTTIPEKKSGLFLRNQE